MLTYANLIRAEIALKQGACKYSGLHHGIRDKKYRELLSGKISMRSLHDDERNKLRFQSCSYCGETTNLAVDHLIPRMRGGPDNSDNSVWACRSCNSSKGGRDMLRWAASKGFFPPLHVLRRYLKLVARYCDKHGCMDLELSEAHKANLPFDIFDVDLLPMVSKEFPSPGELKLWAHPKNKST